MTNPNNNPFANPYGPPPPEPGAGQSGQSGQHGDYGPPPTVGYSWQTAPAPAPYFSPDSAPDGGPLPRPQNVTVLVVIHAILAGVGLFLTFGAAVSLAQGEMDSWGLVLFIVSTLLTLGVAAGLYSRPVPGIRIVATVLSAFWSLLLVTLIITVPIFILLWSKSTTDYLQRSAARPR